MRSTTFIRSSMAISLTRIDPSPLDRPRVMPRLGPRTEERETFTRLLGLAKKGT